MIARAFLVLSLIALAGCVERKIGVKTDPKDALVTIDGQELNREKDSDTAFLSYEHYGIRNVVVRRQGYVAHDELVTLDPPWWQLTPFDLVTDVLLPWVIDDTRTVEVVLKPRDDLGGDEHSEQSKEDLLRRARDLSIEAERHP